MRFVNRTMFLPPWLESYSRGLVYPKQGAATTLSLFKVVMRKKKWVALR